MMLWIRRQESRKHTNAANGSDPVGGAVWVNNRSGDRAYAGAEHLQNAWLPARMQGVVRSMPSQAETVSRARAVRGRLLAIAEASYAAGIPLPMRDELARITGATRRQIDRHISYLRDVGRITIERRQNRAWVGEIAA